MSPLPRALHRARLLTAGALTASTLLVGAIGVHLAESHTQAVATSTTGTTSSSSSSGDASSASQSGTTSSDDSSSSDDSASSGFSAVAPVGNSNAQAQTNSGGS